MQGVVAKLATPPRKIKSFKKKTGQKSSCKKKVIKHFELSRIHRTFALRKYIGDFQSFYQKTPWKQTGALSRQYF